MAEAARRRAAHHAHFQAEDDSDKGGDNIHVGGNEARHLGPWSSAYELARKRGDALEARKARLMAKLHGESLNTDVDWTPVPNASEVNTACPAKRRHVPSLSSFCIDLLVTYIDCIVSLDGVPDSIKVSLADAAAARRRLPAEAVALFVAGAPREVVLKNLTDCDEKALTELLHEASTPRLVRMELGLCGRGFGDKVAAKLAKVQLSSLESLVLGGAYRLSDKGIKTLLEATPNLHRLGLRDACLLQSSIDVLPTLCVSLKHVDLSGCRGLSPEALQGGLLKLKHLSDLSLDYVGDVNDELLKELGEQTPIQRLSINLCCNVTDKGICGLAGARKSALLELSCNDIIKLTDSSLLSLAESCVALERLSLRRCHRMTDAGLAAVAANGWLQSVAVSGVPSVGPLLVKALASFCKDSLEELDISWCRSVTDNMLGFLADSCLRLATITAWGCPAITRKFLDGHSSAALTAIHGPVPDCMPAVPLP